MPSITRNYEAMVIIKSIMTDDMLKGIITKLETILTGGGSTIKEIAQWGRRKLAYEIEKQTEGYYVIYYFTLADGKETIENFERACRYDENVIRFMVVNVPTRKRGQEIAQLVPAPGWMAEYTFAPRPYVPRRPRMPREGGEGGSPGLSATGSEMPPVASEAAPEPAHEPASEPAPEPATQA